MPLNKIEENLTPQLYQFLATAIEILRADKGNVQFYDDREKTLKIVAYIGFNDEFLRVFESVMPGHAACGKALERRERVIVEDTSKDPSFDSIGSTRERFSYAAVTSTPLFDENENFFGIISTHFRKIHRPSDNEFYMFDEYLRRAAPSIARKWASQTNLFNGQMPASIPRIF